MLSQILKKTAKNNRYDLPLHADENTGFLILLVALMGFLMTLTLSFSFSLSHIMSGWTQGLEHKITLEIPPYDSEGVERSAAEMATLESQAVTALNRHEHIKSVNVVSESSLQAMVSSWLGESAFVSDLSLPILISAEFTLPSVDVERGLKSLLKTVDPDIVIDTHASWLHALFKVIATLQIIITSVVAIIGVTTVIAVAGAIKSQIEIHRDDVELLHLMGAQDSYITSQFTRHAAILSFVGAFIGVIISAALVSGLIAFIDIDDGYLSHTGGFSAFEIFITACIPLAISAISSLSAHVTVSAVLKKMP